MTSRLLPFSEDNKLELFEFRIRKKETSSSLDDNLGIPSLMEYPDILHKGIVLKRVERFSDVQRFRPVV